MSLIHSTIDIDALRAIRKALIIGLASFGEIERLENANELNSIGGETIPEELRPVHPTGDADTVGYFATALVYIDILENERIREVETA